MEIHPGKYNRPAALFVRGMICSNYKLAGVGRWPVGGEGFYSAIF